MTYRPSAEMTPPPESSLPPEFPSLLTLTSETGETTCAVEDANQKMSAAKHIATRKRYRQTRTYMFITTSVKEDEASIHIAGQPNAK